MHIDHFSDFDGEDEREERAQTRMQTKRARELAKAAIKEFKATKGKTITRDNIDDIIRAIGDQITDEFDMLMLFDLDDVIFEAVERAINYFKMQMED
jgi:hypothetical protein